MDQLLSALRPRSAAPVTLIALCDEEWHVVLTAGLPLPITLIETASTLAILNLISHIPSLCTLMSDDVVDMLAKGFGLVRLKINLDARPEPYSMVTRADRSLGPAAQRIAARFIEMAEGAAVHEAQPLHPYPVSG